MLQQVALGGTMIALPIYLHMVLEYNAMQAGLSLAPLSPSMFGTALLAGSTTAGPACFAPDHRPAVRRQPDPRASASPDDMGFG